MKSTYQILLHASVSQSVYARVFSQVQDSSLQAELLTIFPCRFAAAMLRAVRPRTT